MNRAFPRDPSRPRLLRRALLGVAGTVAAGSLLAGALVAVDRPDVVSPSVTDVAAARRTANPVTPGDFTGYGFDQCQTPSQSSMDAWLNNSPYLAVGIYISGLSRACRSQPNLTPTWVSTQLANGWRLLPITLGPQASCQPRFPRYSDDHRIDPTPGKAGIYKAARRDGQLTAKQSVADARALGIVAGSTLWYDLEGFDVSNTNCRESALAFLNAWTAVLHDLGYVSGVYSSAGSGIAALDDARANRPGTYLMPDRIWMARWDGVANTSSSYVRSDGWTPGRRVKQFQGGHDETWGGVRINVDRDWLDLGAGSKRAASETHCGGVTISFKDYAPITPPRFGGSPAPAAVRAMKCLLQERGLYSGKLDSTYTSALMAATQKWQTARGATADPRARVFRRDWITLLSYGYRPVLKVGSTGPYVRRVQRSLNATGVGYRLTATGVFDSPTQTALRDYQKRVGVPVTGVVNNLTWAKFMHGKRGR